MAKPKTPSGLGPDGRKLWAWIAAEFSVDGTEPLVTEICRVADRLAEVRKAIGEQGVGGADGKRNPLLDSEMKLSGQFGKLWRTLGLADQSPAAKRPVGRPPGSTRGMKWHA